MSLFSGAGGSLPLDAVGIRPRSRSFVVGSTGSGKSTLSAALLERYLLRYPRHILWVIDPKRRFVPVDPHENDDPARIFPDGWRETNHGRRDGVSVLADPLRSVPRHLPGPGDEHVYLVQDEGLSHDLMEWLYTHSDVRTPSMLYLDESFDIMRGTRADPALRRLLQQGRELGTGVFIINQRPAWVDATFISEADVLYIGRLNKADDRDRVQKEIACEALRPVLDRNLPKHTWIYADQSEPDRSRQFRVRMV